MLGQVRDHRHLETWCRTKAAAGKGEANFNHFTVFEDRWLIHSSESAAVTNVPVRYKN